MEEFLPPMANSFSDSAMVKSKVLTREEVLRRRLRLVKRLDRFYRNHYWALMRNVKSRFGEFHRTYGKSPFEKDQMNNVMNQSVDIINPNGSAHCAARGCKLKAMVLTRYCRKHILADSKQKLYRGCQAVAKNSSTGPLICMKPILRSVHPPACPSHYQLGKKSLIHAVRREAAIPSYFNLNPKFHVVVGEFVHQIQIKRKAALKEIMSMIEFE